VDLQQRLDLYKRYMAAEGAQMDAAAPPVWEMLWSWGIEVPPPPFVHPILLGLVGALLLPIIPFVLWLVNLLRVERRRIPWSFAAACMVAVSVFGLFAFPIYYHRMARRHGLVRWSTFRGVRQRT
jgi:hypothetical protein